MSSFSKVKLHPFSDFITFLIGNKSFLGLSQFPDMNNFLFVHKKALTFVFWIDIKTGNPCISFVSFDFSRKSFDISTIVILPPSDDAYRPNFIYAGDRSQIETVQGAVLRIVVYKYFPSKSSLLSDIIEETEELLQSSFSNNVFFLSSLITPLASVQIRLLPFNRNVHCCMKYVTENTVRKNQMNMTVCKIFKTENPQPLKKLCAIFVANFFPRNDAVQKQLPARLLHLVRHSETFVKQRKYLKTGIRGINEHHFVAFPPL